MAQHPLLGFLCVGYFEVGIEVAQEFASPHPEWGKSVALIGVAQNEWLIYVCSVKAYDVVTSRYLPFAIGLHAIYAE
jgi:hypothetical protein